ncbi:TPA: hypothetical protein JBI81_00925 [Legionella pneumophila]|jgi:hypothetical protein|nr:hypothetical protein [Legionella pneumophila]
MDFEDPYEKMEQLEVLKYLIENDYLSHNEAAQGICRKIIGEKSFDTLSPAQERVYEEEIWPLLNPRCIGVVQNDEEYDDDTCVSGGTVDVASLLESYMDGEMLCQHCRHIRMKHNEE